jgi:DNA-directed RNA polymerase specialized sigma24 family protein
MSFGRSDGGRLSSRGCDRNRLRALASLREADREALLLVAWEGLTSAEAAQALDSSVAAFHVRAFRARRRLLRALATEEVSGTPGARTPSAEEAK